MSRLIYGINPVVETLKLYPQKVLKIYIARERKRKVEEIMKQASGLGIPVLLVSRRDLDTMTGTGKHQGVAARLKPYRYASIQDILGRWRSSGEKAFILILDSIEDPQNLGSLLRTACCAGLHGVIIPKDRACQVTPAVVKASAGASEYIPLARVTNLARTIEELKEEGIWVVGMEGGAPLSIYEADLNLDLAVVIGSEGRGIRPLVREKCDLLVSLPVRGRINSLNASVAGGIAIYEILRRRLSEGNSPLQKT